MAMCKATRSLKSGARGLREYTSAKRKTMHASMGPRRAATVSDAVAVSADCVRGYDAKRGK
eukprot:5917199-Pleurochrysis_carterae.AAC.2